MHIPAASFLGSSGCMAHRPVAIGAASGTLSSLAWRILADTFDPITKVPEVFECQCPAFFPDFAFDLDLKSLVIGLLIGVALGPILELLLVLRHLWVSVIRRQLVALHHRPVAPPLYRTS